MAMDMLNSTTLVEGFGSGMLRSLLRFEVNCAYGTLSTS
jgi:hypothetical protein